MCVGGGASCAGLDPVGLGGGGMGSCHKKLPTILCPTHISHAWRVQCNGQMCSAQVERQCCLLDSISRMQFAPKVLCCCVLNDSFDPLKPLFHCALRGVWKRLMNDWRMFVVLQVNSSVELREKTRTPSSSSRSATGPDTGPSSDS